MKPEPRAEAVLCRYHYDALDRLAAATPLAEATVQRVYQKNRLSVEILGAVHRRVMQFDDHVLAEQRAAETVLPATDLQRSVLHSVDAQGQQGIAYSPYGHRPSASDVFSLLGFTGERPDPVTGHYPLGNGYRSYNPVLMRFNQPDSLSPFGEGGLNAYAYCQGDPVNRSDPTGHMWDFLFNWTTGPRPANSQASYLQGYAAAQLERATASASPRPLTPSSARPSVIVNASTQVAKNSQRPSSSSPVAPASIPKPLKRLQEATAAQAPGVSRRGGVNLNDLEPEIRHQVKEYVAVRRRMKELLPNGVEQKYKDRKIAWDRGDREEDSLAITMRYADQLAKESYTLRQIIPADIIERLHAVRRS
jgi:RHS repeat-associated protein